jgi:hypothetical protein
MMVTATINNAAALCVRITGVGIEQLLAVDLVVDDRFLTFGRNQPTQKIFRNLQRGTIET